MSKTKPKSKTDIIKDTIKGLELGAEIGGQSNFFSSVLPIYKYCKHLDGFNLKDNNYWQKSMTDDYVCGGVKKGKQYYIDAVTLDGYDLLNGGDMLYDYLLNCHVLEHMANPILALNLWRTYIIKHNGYILSVIPDSKQIWDAPRKVTTFEHLSEDYSNCIGEDDTTHIDDAVNNINKEYEGLSYDHYVKHSANNAEMRIIHHHCFDMDLVIKMHEAVGFNTIVTHQIGYHLIYFGNA